MAWQGAATFISNTVTGGKDVQIRDTSWHHIIFYKSGTLHALYIDGQQVRCGQCLATKCIATKYIATSCLATSCLATTRA